MRELLAKDGNVAFWSVKMKPGKQVIFSLFHSGTRNVPHLGLPGNPVSAMVTCEIFARQAIMKMMGKTKLDNIVIDAEMEDGIVSDDGKTIFARVTLRKKDRKYPG